MPPVRLSILIALAATLVLAGCGRRGPLEPPEGAAPDKRPAVEGETPTSRQRLSIGGSRRTLSSPIKPEDKPFVLDPLL